MTLANLIRKHIKTKPEYTYLGDTKIYCSACGKTFNVSKSAVKCHIISHEKSERHRSRHPIWTKQGRLRQQSLVPTDAIVISNPWFKDVTRFFTQANIPLSKVNSKAFHEFCVKNCKLEPPERTTLQREYLKHEYEDIVAQIRAEIGDSDIYLQIDESTMHDRRIVSVLVGKLDGKPAKSRLLHQHELDNPPNRSNVTQVTLDSLRILWDDIYHYDRFKLLLSDQAAYMLAAGESLKATFPQLLHVTCICHALNIVCSTINDNYPEIDTMVNKFEKVFRRSLVRKMELERKLKIKLRSPPC